MLDESFPHKNMTGGGVESEEVQATTPLPLGGPRSLILPETLERQLRCFYGWLAVE